MLLINTTFPVGHSMNDGVGVSEPRRFEITNRSDELESNCRRAVEPHDRVVGITYSDPNIVEVGTLRHGKSNRGEEPSIYNHEMVVDSVVLNTKCEIIPLFSVDDEEDIMMPRLNDTEDNSDDEFDDYEDINISTSIVNEIGNTYNIYLNNIHLSSIDQHVLENLTMIN